MGSPPPPAGAEVRAQLQFSDVDLDQCLSELIGIRRIEGRGTLGFTFESTGASVYELTQALNGTANLASRKARSQASTSSNCSSGWSAIRSLVAADFRSGKTPYEALAVSLKVIQGTAHVEDLRVDAPGVRLTLAGSASIPSRDLDLRGTASLVTGGARDGAQGFELPFLVQGPWDDPLIWPDAQALIKRSGAAAPLLDAVRNRLNAGNSAAPPAEAPAAAPSGPSPPVPPLDRGAITAR